MAPRLSGKAGRRGATLLESLLAILILTVVGLSVLSLLQRVMLVTLKAREQLTCDRMTQAGFARLRNIDFYDVFAADSSSANFGLHAAYPYKAVLTGYKTTLASAKFDRFTTAVVFMRRDTTDSNHDGSTTDLVPFEDGNGDRIDDYDSNVRYFDQNGDGDYWETYVSGGRTIAEQPDTHIKRVTLAVYRRGRQVCSQTELVSLEQFNAASNPSSEASLSLEVSTPSNGAYLYDASNASLAASRALALSKAYPDTVKQLRADAGSALTAAGETSPLSSVNLYVGNSGILDQPLADASGLFSMPAPLSTNALVEGSNHLKAQAVKGGFSSPIAALDVVLDKRPPVATGMTPTGTVGTLAPYVAAALSDLGASTTVVSGVCPDVITMKINGAAVPYKYDAGSGLVVWIDSATDAPPVVSSGTYTAYVEAGDYAGYKTTQTWTFTLSIADPDSSAPSVANKSPIGAAGSDLPAISVRVFDNQSGIVPGSITLSIDGAVVVDAATIGAAYDPATGTVSYTPSAPFPPGTTHTVQVSADHFASSPSNKVNTTDSWSFTVP